MSEPKWKPTEKRPLAVRLTGYRDSLVQQADQIGEIAALTDSHEVLDDAIRFLRLVANDITTLLDGDELRPFVITGIVPKR